MEKTIKETMEEALERRKMAHAKKGGELDSFTGRSLFTSREIPRGDVAGQDGLTVHLFVLLSAPGL